MSSYSAFARHFGTNLASVAKYPLAFILATIFAVLAAVFVMAPSLVGYYAVHGITPIQGITMENPPDIGMTIWAAQCLWVLVGFPTIWAAGKAYLEVQSDE